MALSFQILYKVTTVYVQLISPIYKSFYFSFFRLSRKIATKLQTLIVLLFCSVHVEVVTRHSPAYRLPTSTLL